MFSKDDIYRIWAPPESLWSPWVKPVLFAFVDGLFEFPPSRPIRPGTGWVPRPDSTALVLDLPGDDGVLWALKMAELGYRPVPLYNALPFPVNDKMSSPSSRPPSAVHVETILAALVREAGSLATIHLPAGAPPAFLLDAARRLGRVDLRPGVFDNRSVCFSTDFPSSEFLLSQGIRAVVVVQADTDFARDLLDILVIWQEGGIQILRKKLLDPHPPAAVTVKRPLILSRIWFRLSVAIGLRRNELGGFGGIVPASSG